MKSRLLLVIGLVVGIAGLTALAARADVLSDLGLQPGGSVLQLPPAQLTDPAPEGAQKEPLVAFPVSTCSTGALSTSPSVGFAILNSHPPLNSAGQDSVIIGEVVVEGGVPNATYTVFVLQDPGNCLNVTSAGTLTTNGQGNGNGHFEVSRIPGAIDFWVIAADQMDLLLPKSVLMSPAATLD